MKTDRIDEILKQAVIEIHMKELEIIPDKSSLATAYEPLSDVFYAKIKQIINKIKRQQKNIKMLQNVAAAIFVVLLLSLLANPDAVTKATDAILKWFDNHVRINYEDENEQELLKEHVFGYIPKGFKLENKWYDDELGAPPMGSLDYSCGEEYLSLFYAKNGNVQSLSAEHSILEIINKNGVQIHCMHNEDELYLVWEQNGVTFTMITSLDREEALKVQESIYAIESEKPTEYEITSMPDGYALYYENVNKKGGELRYGSKDDIFELIYTASEVELIIDENDPNLQIVSKDDMELYYYEYENEEKHLLMWYKDGYLFKMTSILDKEEMVKIQDSIQLKAAE